jgi:hypothetical protein
MKTRPPRAVPEAATTRPRASGNAMTLGEAALVTPVSLACSLGTWQSGSWPPLVTSKSVPLGDREHAPLLYEQLLDGGRMNGIGRRVRAAVNPVSTAVTSWWCHSAARHMLTGYGPSARRRRLIRLQAARDAAFPPPAGTMQARAAAIDELLAQNDHKM